MTAEKLNENQRCGTCNCWVGPKHADANGLHWAPCQFPLPDFFWRENLDRIMNETQGQLCPCYQSKQTEGSQTHKGETQ